MPDETSPDDLAMMRETLGQLGRALAGDPVPIASGRNHNWRVETDAGPLFFRRHRYSRPRERIELGLAAMAHAAEHGIPVALPMTGASGDVVFGDDGRFASVYPWVDAQTYERGAITAEQATVLGQVHGHLHRALAGFAHPAIAPATEVEWDTVRSLEQLMEVREEVVAAESIEGFERGDILAQIDEQAALLESGRVVGPEGFEQLAWQPIHGDVHEGNVMLCEDGSVAAVVDWDMVAIAPPLYEVVRAMDFTNALDDEAVADRYLAAYAREAPYPAADASAVVELWAASVIHNTWSLRARFLEGDRRVDRFVPAHRKRTREFADEGYRAWLVGRFAEFATV